MATGAANDSAAAETLDADPSAEVPTFNPEAPTFTPLSIFTMRAEAAEFIPYGGLAMVQDALEAYKSAQSAQSKQKRQMPPATEEEWETRIAKREKEVMTIKSLQSYRLYAEVFPHDKRGDDEPKTPDPRDRTVSKRMWKWNVEKWRLQLKGRCVYSRAFSLQCREHMLRAEKELEATGAGAATPPTPVAAEAAAPEVGAADAADPAAPRAGEGEEAVEEELSEPQILAPGVLRTMPLDLCPGPAAATAAPAAGRPTGAGKFQ